MWNNIIGQVQIIERLRTIHRSGRVSHAYLFYGTEGSGKDAAAVEFAKLLNCTANLNGEACDKCANCKNIASLRSDFFHFITAIPSGRSETNESSPLEFLSPADYENYIEQTKLKSVNPYHHIRLQGANNIRINSIRELINKIYLSSPVQEINFIKVFLISGAEKMKQEASNALLKVLEEPPKNSVIIMTTSKHQMLPPTIAGRCQRIYFPPLSATEIEEGLSSRMNTENREYTRKEIALASKFAQGSYSRAYELLSAGLKESRETMLNFLIAILKEDYAETVNICREESSKKSKERISYFLMQLSIWFRDLLWMKKSNAGNEVNMNNLANADLVERLEKFHKNYPNLDVFNIISSIEEAEKLVFENVQAQLVLIDLSFKLRRYLQIEQSTV